jgi:hypothetical protein
MKTVLSAVLALCAAGCDATALRPAEVVGEERQAIAGEVPRDRGLGHPCEAGRAQCDSDLCVNTRPRGGKGRICSRLCGHGRPGCEPGYVCVQGYPSDDGWWCLPADPGMAEVQR